ncbi:PAS domain-containing sensor histidine kinase [Piscinibacter sakaiensis]|uniref:histidine kinase n=1 Tax=Piscinibacter sakaiensis TaxID=1547922 RepID=A0A0K8NVK5_PISS1|nr:PAS domain S-box protein [Piscinibacter sakaiensis]GAP34422.1 PAS/PAC sensor signal transduction histidine kinase [Piscinibacter sakaiensis]
MPDPSKWLAAESPDALILLDREGVVRHWNAGARAMYGFDADEASGRPFAELVVPDDRHPEQALRLAEALRDGGCTYESVRRRQDGTRLYVDVTQRRVEAPDGTLQVLAAEKDVTLIKVQRDAKLMEARFRDLLESTPDGIVMANPTGHIVIANSQAERLFGYGPGELRGLTVEALLPQRDRHAHVGHRSGYFLQPRTRAMGSGLDLAGLRKDGSEFPIEISLSPLRTDDSAYVMSAIRDISERKRIEQALQEKNLELARANQEKSRFLAGMSHELRTPLNAIIGFTGILLMKLPGPLNDEQVQQLQTVQTSARHLLALINDLLDVSKIEAGRLELALEEVDVGALVEEVASALRPQALGKGLALQLLRPDEAVVLRTDRRALRQIVFNLVGNAVKFTAAGQVVVTLTRHGEGGPAHTEVAVEDTGIGIAEADRHRLFAAFTRLHEEQGSTTEGSGLGLHLSQRLAGRLGGRITLRSAPGVGSRFALELPERPPGEAPRPPDAGPHPALARDPGPRHPAADPHPASPVAKEDAP